MSVTSEIITAIAVFWREHEYGPSLRNVSELMRGEPSTSHLSYWVRKLRADGLVRYDDGVARSLRLTRMGWVASMMAPPLLGSE